MFYFSFCFISSLQQQQCVVNSFSNWQLLKWGSRLCILNGLHWHPSCSLPLASDREVYKEDHIQTSAWTVYTKMKILQVLPSVTSCFLPLLLLLLQQEVSHGTSTNLLERMPDIQEQDVRENIIVNQLALQRLLSAAATQGTLQNTYS